MSKDTKPVTTAQPNVEPTPAPGELKDSELDKVSGGILGVAPSPERVLQPEAPRPPKAGGEATGGVPATTFAYDLKQNKAV